MHAWCHLRLKMKVVEFYAVCLLYIDRNTVIEQTVLLFRTYSYKWKQFVALPYCVTLQTTEHRIPILNWSCSFIVGYRRKAVLMYLNSTSAILVLSTGIGIFLWRNTKQSLKNVQVCIHAFIYSSFFSPFPLSTDTSFISLSHFVFTYFHQFIDLQYQLNMFREIFAHLQERKTEIFAAYGILWFSSCWSGVELRVMCPVSRMLQLPAHRTHNPQLWQIPQAATTV